MSVTSATTGEALAAPACPPEVIKEINKTNALLGLALLQQPLNERLLERCRELHARTLKQDGAFWFGEPVDEVKNGAVGYYTIITHPMDLATMRKRYLDGDAALAAHRTLLDFLNDGRIMWQNSFRFNAPNYDPFVCADRLARYWETQIRRLFGSEKAQQAQADKARARAAAKAASDLPLSRSEYEELAQKLARLSDSAQTKFIAMATADDEEEQAAQATADKTRSKQRAAVRRRSSNSTDIDLALLPPAKVRKLAAFVNSKCEGAAGKPGK